MKKNIFMFDVESIGLYGNGFAFGAVASDAKGQILDKCAYAYLTEEIIKELNKIDFFVNGDGKDIISECKKLQQVKSLKELRQKFYDFYLAYKSNCDIYSDVNFPVETNFLKDVVMDDIENRQFTMPYPLLDVANVVPCNIDRAEMYIQDNAGYIAQDVANRKPVKHNPLWDSMCSLYCLIKELR
jgi:hypothetical protein